MSGSHKAGQHHEALVAYQSSRLDRHGSDGALILRAIPFVAVMFGGWTLLFSLLGAPLIVAILPAGLLTAGLTWAGLNAASAIGRLFGRFLLPTGDSTPYEHQFSREDAMAAAGDTRGALDSLEQYIASTPLEAQTGINVRIRAAELYMGKGADPKRAAELFREIQRHAVTSPSQDIYVSNRLIDLLLGPLADRSRALVELRRIVERYPTSSAATGARTAIARLKDELRAETAENEKYTGF